MSISAITLDGDDISARTPDGPVRESWRPTNRNPNLQHKINKADD